jgi:hypothetical protein
MPQLLFHSDPSTFGEHITPSFFEADDKGFTSGAFLLAAGDAVALTSFAWDSTQVALARQKLRTDNNAVEKVVEESNVNQLLSSRL